MGPFGHGSVLTAVVLCTACAGAGGGGQLACTQIAAQPGISITVAQSMAGSIVDPTLEICDDECRTYDLALEPGSDSVDLGCDSPEPEGSCSASVRPNGTLVGFVVVDQLGPGPVEVSLLSGADRYSTTGTPQLVYPNGPGCPGEALQLPLTLDDGTLTA